MNEKTINVWQTGIILFLVLLANKILVLPSLVFRDANLEGFFTVLILFAFEFLLIALFIFLKRKYKNITFSSLLKEKFGIFIQKTIFLLISIFFCAKIILAYNVTYSFFKDLIYKDSNAFLYLICFLPIMIYLAFVSLRSVARTAQILLPLLIFIMVFCVLASFVGTHSTPLLFQSGITEVLNTTVKHTTAFGDSIFLLLFFDKIQIKRGDGKKLYFFAIIAAIFVILIFISFYYAFTYTAFFHPYAIFEILGGIRAFGGIGRVDVISVVLVMFLTYFQLGIFLKCFSRSVVEVFPNINIKYPLIFFAFVFVISMNLIVRNIEKTIIFAEKYMPFVSIISFVIIPLVLIILLCWRRKNE